MRCTIPGHVYKLADKAGDPNEEQEVHFSGREPGYHKPGTTTQEFLRMLIDRTRYCNNCLPHPNNERIIYHLRMALVLHECRALERQTQKGEIEPEHIITDEKNGHYKLPDNTADSGYGDNLTFSLEPYTPEWKLEQPIYPKGPK